MTARDPLRSALRSFHAAGGRVRRDGLRVLLDTTTSSATVQASDEAVTVLRRHQEALERLCVPAVSAEQAERTRAVLAAAGATRGLCHRPMGRRLRGAGAARRLPCRTGRTRACGDRSRRGDRGHRRSCADRCRWRSPRRARWRSDSRRTASLVWHSIRTGSYVRLCQLWPGRGPVQVFDMHAVPWSVLDPLLDDPAIAWAAFAATFEAKRLIRETGRMPAGRLV